MKTISQFWAGFASPGLWISNQPYHQGLCYISISFTHTCMQLLNAKLTLDILLKPTQLYKIVQINMHNYAYNICGWYVYHNYFYVSYQKTIIILCFNKMISTLFLVFGLCLLNNLIVYPIASIAAYWIDKYCYQSGFSPHCLRLGVVSSNHTNILLDPATKTNH